MNTNSTDTDRRKTDERYMRRCIQLARNGQKNAQPNPMVGAVVVCGGRIIGEGYHVRCGQGHAEVNALASVRPEDEHLLPQSTIYVSLEPCAHYGKTPPCADLIASKRLRRCVVGCVDPFAKVHGLGIRKLLDAGIEVTVGVLEDECRRLNKRFMTFHTLHRPFITLKWAQTADGYIGYCGQTPERPLRISDEQTRTLCHKRRAEHQAILVGRHTEQTDSPALTVRDWVGDDPRRLVLTRQDGPLGSQMHRLWEEGIQSLLVEGGAETLQAFIDAGLWDEAYVETAPQTLGQLLAPYAGDLPDGKTEGVPAPVLTHARLRSTDRTGGHLLAAYTRTGR